jgi:Protease inhibitor Inh
MHHGPISKGLLMLFPDGGSLQAALAVAVLLLSACTSTEQLPPGTAAASLGIPIVAGEPPPQGSARLQPQGGLFAPTPPPFGAPAGARSAAPSPVIQRTNVTERSTISPDGSTIRTERTTTSVGLDPNKAAGALGALASAGVAQGGIQGAWQMQSSSNGAMCSVFLYGQPGAASGAATSSGCPVGGIMSGITGWSYDGGRLTITKGGSTAITLSQQGPNRFDGTATWGFLSTRIALYR